jgi:hypothetical protein
MPLLRRLSTNRPIGFGDECKSGGRAGCVDLLHVIRAMQPPPRVHLFGHIHEGYGCETGVRTCIGLRVMVCWLAFIRIGVAATRITCLL